MKPPFSHRALAGRLPAVLLGLAASPCLWAQLGTFTSHSLPAEPVPELLFAAPTAHIAQPVEVAASAGGGGAVSRFFDNLNLDLVDNSAVGLANEQTVTGVPGPIASLQVTLNLEARGGGPMFNGDLFVTLTHDSGYAVLLNRVGRREDSLTGYGDSGFQITFSDAAAADVHNYRLTLGGSHGTPLSATDDPAALTGVWQPDGRAVDPATVLSSSPRSAGLDSFAGIDPNGVWTLYLADLGEGGLVRLTDWGLEIVPVPEPDEVLLISGLVLAVFAVTRRRRA